MTDRVSSFQSGPSTTFYVEGDLYSQSVAGNYSVVRCYLRAKNGPGGTTGSNYGGSGYQAGTIAGVKEFARRSASSNFLPSGYADGQQRWRVGPYDVQVDHNSDGTRDPIRFGMVLSYGAVSATVFSADMSLPTIARRTIGQIRVGSTPVTALDLGTAATIYLPRASSSFTHTLVLYEYGGGIVETLATGVGVSYAWTPPLDLAQRFPDASSQRFFVRTITYSGSTEIGRHDAVFTLNAPASMVPTISAINVVDSNPTVASAIGALVQGQSRVQATVVAAGVQGSTITSSAFALDGQTASSGESLPVPTAGTRTVAASVTDSRGRVGTQSGTVAVLAYDLPKINEFTVDRATSAGVVSPNGTYLRMTLNAAISSLIAGSQKNSATIRVFTRPRGTTPWTARNVITAALAYNTSVLITGGGIYAASTAYDVRVEVSDKLQKSEDYWSVSTAGAIVDATATKQAFGKMVEAAGPDTQIQGPARVYGALDADGDIGAPALYQNGRKTLSLQQTLYFASSATFTKATYPWLQAARVRLVGGGGAGGGAGAGGSGAHSAGGGGGGGGYAEAMIPAASIPTSVTVTVGAGATGIQGQGGVGGTSQFGSLVSASGGNPGQYFASSVLMLGAQGGVGGTGSIGDVLIQGGPGSMGSGNATLAHGGEGGSSLLGGGGSGYYSGANASSQAGNQGGNYGGGGGGAAVNQSGAANKGGDGASGIVIVELYA